MSRNLKNVKIMLKLFKIIGFREKNGFKNDFK